jgi:hypothetical protein
MITKYNKPMTKVQITLTDQEAEILSTKASRLGYGITRYIKSLISREVMSTIDPFDNLPTFPMNVKQERILERALKDDREGKTHILKNPDDMLKW